ncbi:MAG: EAL domain-containing protein [Spongiibacteraceae bacterium]
MIARRDKILLEILAAVLLGVLLLVLLGRYVWQQSVRVEERRLQVFSQQLGQQVEQAMIDARDLLILLNNNAFPPCSSQHLQLMQESAVARPYIRAIGYWRAADRLCGAGFIQGLEFTPPRASRIYDTGVIAWWPSKATEVGGVQLFLMRFGEHDVVIDPRLLINVGPLQDQRAELWVEGLLMISTDATTDLPPLDSLALGLTVDRDRQRVLSRFSLGSVFPIDVVAQQPINQLWLRYMPALLVLGGLVMMLIILWGFIVLRYSRRRLSLTAELRSAIARGNISVKYQPIVNMQDLSCYGAESLARWTREGGEEVSPDVFIPIVEKAGLNTELARVMLKAILRETGVYLRQHPGFIINLNLAAQDLESDRMMNYLAQELAAAGVSARSIGLEITERALVDSDAARQRIHLLRQRGHRIAIDDFGTGYSSLSYLQSFELDVLKVDKSFVDAIETHGVTSNVITHIIEMAQSLKLDIVAEGIESDHQAQWLIRQNVVIGQGYVFSKPLSAEQFIEFAFLAMGPNNGNIVKFREPTRKYN